MTAPRDVDAGPALEVESSTPRISGTATSSNSSAWLGQVSSILSRYVHGTVALGKTEPRLAEPEQTVSTGVVIGDRYRVQRLIGEGGMGSVYEVVHNNLGKSFALKLIKGTMTAAAETQRLFFREARYASRLQHSSLPDVVDFGHDSNLGWFMVVEYLDGENLNSLVRRTTKLEIKHATNIVLQIAEGLHAIHDSGLVHCDIKAENVMICQESVGGRRRETVKLIDFGLARSKALAPRTSITGTPHYIAPELIHGAQPSPSTDIYALGIVFYYLVSGKLPFEGTMTEVLAGHLNEPIPSLSSIPNITKEMEGLIAKALSKDPAMRHSDCLEFINELQSAMDSVGMRRRVGSPIASSDVDKDLLSQGLPIPVAIVRESGLIQNASLAFARVAVGASTCLAGRSIFETPLSHFWSELKSDIERAMDGGSVRCVLEIVDVDREVTRLMACVDPMPTMGSVCLWVYPLDPG